MSSETNRATGLTGRYASALIELAVTGSSLDNVATDLTSMRTMIKESADLDRVMNSPVISREDQIKAVTALCAKAKMCDLTINFIGIVAQNRRLPVLTGMINAFLDELSRRRGEAKAQVTSAKKLTAGQLKAVSDVLKKSVGTKLSLEANVDETLLGGMIVKVGSRMIDSSLKTKLQQLQLSMKGIG